MNSVNLSKWLAGIAVVLVLIIVGTGLYFSSKVKTLNTQLVSANAAVRIVSDSIQHIKTKYGEIATQYALVQSTAELLKQQAYYKDKQIYVLQQTVVLLQSKLPSDTVWAEMKGDSLIYATFNNTYKDSGVNIHYKDSVNFTKRPDLGWNGQNFPSFDIEAGLTMTTGRNAAGEFYGSVESLSPIVHIMSLKTVVDDKYIPQPVPKHSFAIGGSLDMFTFAPGVRLTLSSWQIGGEYILFSNTAVPVIQRIRISGYYFLF